jgi:hypothetical protein
MCPRSSNAKRYHWGGCRVHTVRIPSRYFVYLFNTDECPKNYRSTKSSIDVPALQGELSDVLASAAELSNTRAAKVVGYRSEQHATLDLGSFLGFFNESWSFVVKCEVICRRMIVGLRGAVVSQVCSHVVFVSLFCVMLNIGWM